jgi:hypothetical protein
MLSTKAKAWLDTNLSKFISRKFLVFITATVWTSLGLEIPDSWTAIAVTYIGTEGAADIMIRMRTNTLSPKASTAKGEVGDEIRP